VDHLQTRALVQFLEAAYCFEAGDEGWLQAVTTAAAAVAPYAIAGVHGVVYDASDVSTFRVVTMHFDGPPRMLDIILASVGDFTPHFVARTFRTLLSSPPLGRAGSAPELESTYVALGSIGISDCIGVNGFDPAGLGVFVGLWVPEPVSLDKTQASVLRRMAHHLGAAHRCRRRLREEQRSVDPASGAEAILDRRGRVVHASGPAKEKTAQADLIETSKAREIARSRRGDREQALGRWRPLTSARWTLVDRFERDGARYVVARENQAQVRGLLALSDRERQVVAYLALGQSTKETAYALGISDTTVRVHLAHAATKLGVRTRGQLLLHPEVQSLRPNVRTRREPR
jgi:DNA-binding CsgD family transcriptional regulator